MLIQSLKILVYTYKIHSSQKLTPSTNIPLATYNSALFFSAKTSPFFFFYRIIIVFLSEISVKILKEALALASVVPMLCSAS